MHTKFYHNLAYNESLMEFSLIILAVVCTGIYVIIDCSLLIGFFRLRPCQKCHKPPVSVIIAARNEEANIKNCLDAISKQNYPKNLLEVVVVDENFGIRIVSLVSPEERIRSLR